MKRVDLVQALEIETRTFSRKKVLKHVDRLMCRTVKAMYESTGLIIVENTPRSRMTYEALDKAWRTRAKTVFCTEAQIESVIDDAREVSIFVVQDVVAKDADRYIYSYMTTDGWSSPIVKVWNWFFDTAV